MAGLLQGKSLFLFFWCFICRLFLVARLAVASIFLLLSLLFIIWPNAIFETRSSQPVQVVKIWSPDDGVKSDSGQDEDDLMPAITICSQNKVSRSRFLSALASPSLPWKGGGKGASF